MPVSPFSSFTTSSFDPTVLSSKRHRHNTLSYNDNDDNKNIKTDNFKPDGITNIFGGKVMKTQATTTDLATTATDALSTITSLGNTATSTTTTTPSFSSFNDIIKFAQGNTGSNISTTNSSIGIL